MSNAPIRDPAAPHRPAPVRGRRLGPRWRKAVLSAHIIAGVGWLGASYTILVLGVLGARTPDSVLRLGAYQVMHAFNWAVNTPLALTMLLTGATLGLGTRFGIVRHWWVLAKLGISVTVILVNQQLLQPGVEIVIDRLRGGIDPGPLPEQLVAVSVGIVIALTAVVAVAVFKPWGPTRRRHPARSLRQAPASSTRGSDQAAQRFERPAGAERWRPTATGAHTRRAARTRATPDAASNWCWRALDVVAASRGHDRSRARRRCPRRRGRAARRPGVASAGSCPPRCPVRRRRFDGPDRVPVDSRIRGPRRARGGGTPGYPATRRRAR